MTPKSPKLSILLNDDQAREVGPQVAGLMREDYKLPIIQETNQVVTALMPELQNGPPSLVISLGQPLADSQGPIDFVVTSTTGARGPGNPRVILPATQAHLQGPVPSGDFYDSALKTILDGLLMPGIIGFDWVDLRRVLRPEKAYLLRAGKIVGREKQGSNPLFEPIDRLFQEGAGWETAREVLLALRCSKLTISAVSDLLEMLEKIVPEDAHIAVYGAISPSKDEEEDIRLLWAH